MFEIGADDILSLKINELGLSKDDNELALVNNPTGGITATTDGLRIKLKAGGGVSTDADGLYITTSSTAGDVAGMQVTIKDTDEIYVWGGHIEINGLMYHLGSRATIDASGLSATTLYYLYVTFPASGIELGSGQFSLSTTAATYDHAKGAYYKSDDANKRWLANVQTVGGGAVSTVSQNVGKIINLRRDTSNVIGAVDSFIVYDATKDDIKGITAAEAGNLINTSNSWGNLDNGHPDSTFGGVSPIDCGGVT